MRHSVFIACLLCVLFAAGSNAAATVVKTGNIQDQSVSGMPIIQSNGDGNIVTLATNNNACDKTVLWGYDSDGFIYRLDNKTLVLDVQNANPANGAPVIMWYKKSPPATNQLWDVYPDHITSRLNGFSLRKSSSSNNLVMSNNQPIQNFVFASSPYSCPDTCQSNGDPHFTDWLGEHFNYQNAATVLLANYSKTLIYAVQFNCNTGVTCNEGMVAQPAGTTDTFQITGSNIFYYNKQRVTPPSGTTSYGSYFNFTKISSTSFKVTLPGGYISYGAYTWAHGTYVNLAVTLTSTVTPGRSLCLGPATGDAHAYGNQFVVQNKNDTAYQYAVTPFNYDPNYVPNYGPYTTNDTALQQQATSNCSALSSPAYATCNALVDPTFYKAMCYNDTIATGNVLFIQMAYDAYFQQCSQAAATNGTNVTLPTSASTTMVVNVQTPIPSGSTTTFTIVAKDVNGNNRTTGGDSFTITSTGPSTLTFAIVDNNDGTYTVTYTIGAEGVYTISVKLSNISDISNSPFQVTATAVTSASTSGLVLGPVPTNTQSCFTVQARTASGTNRAAGGDTFAASSTSSTITNIMVMDNMDGTYTVCYTPTTPGQYPIDVTYMGTSISCSPYTIYAKAPSMPMVW